MWKVAVVVVAGVPAVYLLYTLGVVLRLLLAARHLVRDCASRHLEVEWGLFNLFPCLEDPVCLSVVLRRDQRQFKFNVFRALRSFRSHWEFVSVDVEPVLLASKLRGHVYVDPNDALGDGLASHYLRHGKAAIHSFDVEELDTRYRLCEQTSKANHPEALALLRSTFAHPAVRMQMLAYGGRLAFEFGRLTVTPAARGAPFLDGVEQVALLADALDSAAAGAGAYR